MSSNCQSSRHWQSPRPQGASVPVSPTTISTSFSLSKPTTTNNASPTRLPPVPNRIENGAPHSPVATTDQSFTSSPELSRDCSFTYTESHPSALVLGDASSVGSCSRLVRERRSRTTESFENRQQQQQSLSQPTHSQQQPRVSGIIRRISQGAKNRIRRRKSSNHMSHSRDRSSGPVMMRRRSNSKIGTESPEDENDSTREPDIEDVPEDPEPIVGLGVEGITLEDGSSSLRPARTRGGIAPVVPNILQEGTRLIKITKKKRKVLTFVLDADMARVSWNGSDTSKSFHIDDIQEIRVQSDAQIPFEAFQLPLALASRCFAIRYNDHKQTKGRQQKTIYLIAETQHIYEIWTSTLEQVSKYRHDLMAGLAGSYQDQKTILSHWKVEMARIFAEKPQTSEEESLDFSGIVTMCRSLHIHCTTNELRVQFDLADKRSRGRLSYHEFEDFVRGLKDRKEIRKIFSSLSYSAGDDEGLSQAVFLYFLRDVQGVDVDARPDHWIRVFNKYVRKTETQNIRPPDVRCEGQEKMNFNAFCAFLCSPTNQLLAARPVEVCFDRPLNEYFISSSHNTYLLGRQVGGNSSVEAYIIALQRGCRCVEIDCWDGPDGRPIVLHGRTMTSSVPFSECTSTIAKYAFDSSEYPLIISLEVHCNARQQQKMVDILIKDFGTALVRETLKPGCFQLPSPEELKRRILIKVKSAGDEQIAHMEANLNRLDGALNFGANDVSGHSNKSSFSSVPYASIPASSTTPAPATASYGRDRSRSSPWSRSAPLDDASSTLAGGIALSSPPSIGPEDRQSTWPTSRPSITASTSSNNEDSDSSKNDTLVIARRASSSAATSKTTQASPRGKIIASLGSLAIYTRGIKLTNFTHPDAKPYNHVFSIAERRFEELCKNPDSKAQLEKHNMHHLMRVYPSGFRIHSSNPDPLVFWRRGVQMVALNWQTYDLPLQMNDAMFASGSDSFGYVLKPGELRESASIQEEMDNPSIHGLGKIRKQVICFSVDVISAQQLPKPRSFAFNQAIDPYIEIELFSAEDKARGVASGSGGQNASARNGMSGIGSPHRRRTAVVQANGFNPLFNESFKLSLETKYPSLVFVRWTVWNSQNGQDYQTPSSNAEPLATFTAKLSSLQQGYRHIPLFDHVGEQFMFATLFCKIRKDDTITVEREDPVPERRRGIKSVISRTLSVGRGEGTSNHTGMAASSSNNANSKSFSEFHSPTPAGAESYKSDRRAAAKRAVERRNKAVS